MLITTVECRYETENWNMMAASIHEMWCLREICQSQETGKPERGHCLVHWKNHSNSWHGISHCPCVYYVASLYPAATIHFPKSHCFINRVSSLEHSDLLSGCLRTILFFCQKVTSAKLRNSSTFVPLTQDCDLHCFICLHHSI